MTIPVTTAKISIMSRWDILSFRNIRAPRMVTMGYADISGKTMDADPTEIAEVSAK